MRGKNIREEQNKFYKKRETANLSWCSIVISAFQFHIDNSEIPGDDARHFTPPDNEY